MNLNSKKIETYAGILFEEDSSPEFLKQWKLCVSFFTEEPSVFRFFCAPHLSFEEKKTLLDKALQTASPLLQNFFQVLLKNKAFFLLPEIEKKYQELWNKKNQVALAQVFSSQALTEEEKKDLKQKLEKVFNKKIELEEKEDKSLIAGLRVNVEGSVFEASINHFLKQFEQSGGF